MCYFIDLFEEFNRAVRKKIIRTIRDSPGVTNKQLADSIGINKGTVSWHIKILKNTDIISEEIAKNQRNYFLK
ncbi:winged helix-turn-helix domain-containing protein [Methanogenium cariaci]